MTQRIVDMTVTELSEKLRSRKLSAEEDVYKRQSYARTTRKGVKE